MSKTRIKRSTPAVATMLSRRGGAHARLGRGVDGDAEREVVACAGGGAQVEHAEVAVAADAADDAGGMGAELGRVGAAVGGQRGDAGVVVGVPDLDGAVPRRGEECIFGHEVPVHAEHLARVLGPRLDRELRYVDVEELDRAVAACCEDLRFVRFRPCRVKERVLCVEPARCYQVWWGERRRRPAVSHESEVGGAGYGYARIEERRVLDAVAIETLCAKLQHDMDAFVSRKRKRVEPQKPVSPPSTAPQRCSTPEEEESTDFKLALLASLHPSADEATLLEALLVSDGSVETASTCLAQSTLSSPRKRRGNATVGYQSSLSLYRLNSDGSSSTKKPLVRKGKTLYLFSPEDIEQHTPCSIIYNFLPAQQANSLLQQLLNEVPTYQSLEFKLFDRVVTSPHTFCFYVNSLAEVEEQQTEYTYDGRKLQNVQQSLPEMLSAVPQVEEAVNREIQRRIRDFYPNGEKLKHQSPQAWKANTAFVNCYDGPQQHVGYHADQLTYLGPRAVIGSLSLGVAREFRVRKIHAEDDQYRKDDGSLADAQGQISIHLPHNSLLIMHAEMQEEWKHSIAPAQAIDPHSLAQNKRLNITYRFYKDSLHPRVAGSVHVDVPHELRAGPGWVLVLPVGRV
ncbi:hypothetical protein OPT61_g10533 [Boeremia exigua]|uniref:Uncharacterized protein n=1 Tax=Boeremia exigua TaxID=749465 RepID=A0ACC2HPY0_9PLEO|nr:hypothetical protein OPT61_g10533 [Boeremia exigua]